MVSKKTLGEVTNMVIASRLKPEVEIEALKINYVIDVQNYPIPPFNISKELRKIDPNNER